MDGFTSPTKKAVFSYAGVKGNENRATKLL